MDDNGIDSTEQACATAISEPAGTLRTTGAGTGHRYAPHGPRRRTAPGTGAAGPTFSPSAEAPELDELGGGPSGAGTEGLPQLVTVPARPRTDHPQPPRPTACSAAHKIEPISTAPASAAPAPRPDEAGRRQ